MECLRRKEGGASEAYQTGKYHYSFDWYLLAQTKGEF